ncbi:MAG: hypothetical protein JW839_06695 [Candidatus Lokiarchaeota archaeon]|nr:hypothetical protein [Candidatus Lokiarchaeota archaeon]
MAIEPFIEKLNQNVRAAQESLRSQLLGKVTQLASQVDKFTPDVLRAELEALVDDFLSEFVSTYQEFIMYIEEELPEVAAKPRPPKPKEKPARKERPAGSQKPDFVRPTFVQRAFNDEGLRVSKDARPMLMEILNKTIKEDIDRIKQQLPSFQGGDKNGLKKRVTIRPADVTPEKLTKPATAPALAAGAAGAAEASVAVDGPAAYERELGALPLGDAAPGYKVSILVRPE